MKIITNKIVLTVYVHIILKYLLKKYNLIIIIKEGVQLDYDIHYY